MALSSRPGRLAAYVRKALTRRANLRGSDLSKCMDRVFWTLDSIDESLASRLETRLAQGSLRECLEDRDFLKEAIHSCSEPCWKSQRSHHLPLDDYQLSSREGDPAEICEQHEEFAAYREALGKELEKLPEQDRRILLGVRFEGRKQVDVATELGITPQKVNASLSKTKELLSNRLSRFKSLRHTA